VPGEFTAVYLSGRAWWQKVPPEKNFPMKSVALAEEIGFICVGESKTGTDIQGGEDITL